MYYYIKTRIIMRIINYKSFLKEALKISAVHLCFSSPPPSAHPLIRPRNGESMFVSVGERVFGWNACSDIARRARKR